MNTNRALIIILFETGYDLKTEKDEIGLQEFEDIVMSLDGEIMVFDWKEEEEGQAWEEKMLAKGYAVRNLNDGGDSYILIASYKMSIIELIAKYINITLVVPDW